jgi:hypothetical protein
MVDGAVTELNTPFTRLRIALCLQQGATDWLLDLIAKEHPHAWRTKGGRIEGVLPTQTTMTRSKGANIRRSGLY